MPPGLPTAAAEAATSAGLALSPAVAHHMHTAAATAGRLPGSAAAGGDMPSSTPPAVVRPAASPASTVNLRDSLRYFIAGNIAGMCGVVVGQPFDTLKVRMQTQTQVAAFQAERSASSPAAAARFVRHNFAAPSYYGQPIFSVGAGNHYASASTTARAAASSSLLFTSPWQCFLSTVRGSGIRGLYRGMSSPLLLVGCQKSVAFGVFGTVVQHLQRSAPLPSLSHVCVAGVAGGVANSLILCPVDQLKIAMQIQGYGRPTTSVTAELLLTGTPSAPQPRLVSTAQQLIREQGFLRGIYGNFRATLLREVPMYSIYYTLYSYLHRLYIVDLEGRSRWATSAGRSSAPPSLSLLTDGQKEVLTKLSMGGVTGVGCWASCYPLDTIKSAMVTQTAQNIRREERRNIRQMIAHIYQAGGLPAFYRGLTPALLRAFPVHAVVFFTFATASGWLQAHDM